MMVLEKRLCPSAKVKYTVSGNIILLLYHDTKEVIYQYTQNVCHCISIAYIFLIYVATYVYDSV